MAYIRGENKPDDATAGHQCPFCRIPRLDDDEGLVVHRGELSYVVLNLYPYSPGHLMVCPYRHIAGLHRGHAGGDRGDRRAHPGRRCARSAR